MNKPPPGRPAKPPVKQSRLSRESAALRANLLKRKDQARARGAGKEGQPPGRRTPPEP